MVGAAITIAEPNLLLVEGEMDRRFLSALFAVHGRTDVQVVSIGGRDLLPATIMATVQTKGFGRVRWFGIARDADDDASSAFVSVCGALQRARLAVPSRPWARALSRPATCAIIFPDGQRSGDIESWAWDAVAGGPSAPCVEAYLQCLRTSGAATVPRESKARMYAYLASLNRPEMRLSEAAEAGMLPLTSGVFDRLLDLLP